LVFITHCRLTEKKHTQEELSFTIVPEDLDIRRTERHSERRADTSLEVKWPMCFTINTKTEMTRAVHAPAELIMFERPFQRSNRREV
jgi:hypothetical protein